MTVIVLASAKGSPGVTTTALALTTTWPLRDPGAADTPDAATRVSLMDADLAGSGVAAGYLRGAVPDSGGLVHAAIRSALAGTVTPETVALDETGRRGVLLGINDPVQARSVAPTLVPAIEALHERGDVLVDLGRLTGLADHDTATDVLDAADLAVVVCRSSLASVSATRHLVTRLRARTDHTLHSRTRVRVGVVVVGPDRPYPSRDVARSVGADVVAELAWDPTSAAVFSDGEAPRWRFPQSAMLRSARATATALHRLAGLAPSPVEVTRG